ncbi:MAG: helix-turn-helix transcriptional regulator [Paracoccaceae bacterium]|nr:helix-turn-helix transcriptional regulator [Paracoccaceae bacterium]MDE2674604.1 helix-turn-helix transcriptional regulator [Paracoccaceae bacterium]
MSSKLSENFQKRLRTARIARNLNQSQLAQRARLQTSAISHFETGTRKPSFDNLKHLADALEVTTDYLLGRSTHMDSSSNTVDRLHRQYSGLSSEYQDVADEIIDMLAQKSLSKNKGNK